MTTTKPDECTARDDGPRFTPHPEGQFAAVCVDAINLGERLESFGGKSPKITPKVALVFRTGEQNADDALIDVSAEFSLFMSPKAALRLFLESWRGKSYTDEQAREGVPLHKLAGNGALLSVEHKTSAGGRTYAKIKSVAPLPKQMPAPAGDGYQRADYWAERKTEYAEQVRKHRAETVVARHGDEPDPTDSGEDDDDLPF